MKGMILQVVLVLFGSQEVPVEQVMRYTNAIEQAVKYEPLPFTGNHAKERTAILLAKMVYQESGFREEIEFCRSPHRYKGWEDDGKSIGLSQLYEGAARYKHSKEEICGNAELQFRLALRYLTEQVKKCKRVQLGLGSYNSNRCFPSIYSIRIMNGYQKLASQFGLLMAG